MSDPITPAISKVDSASTAADYGCLKKKDTRPYLVEFLASKGVNLDEETQRNLGWIPTESLMKIALAIKAAKAEVVEA